MLLRNIHCENHAFHKNPQLAPLRKPEAHWWGCHMMSYEPQMVYVSADDHLTLKSGPALKANLSLRENLVRRLAWMILNMLCVSSSLDSCMYPEKQSSIGNSSPPYIFILWLQLKCLKINSIFTFTNMLPFIYIHIFTRPVNMSKAVSSTTKSVKTAT